MTLDSSHHTVYLFSSSVYGKIFERQMTAAGRLFHDFSQTQHSLHFMPRDCKLLLLLLYKEK